MVQMKERSRNWKKAEIHFFVKLKVQMQPRFNKATVKPETLWQEISENMKGRGYVRSAEICVRKWRNLVRGCKSRREKDPLREVYEEIEKLCNAQPGDGTVRRSAINIDTAVGELHEPPCIGNIEDKDEIIETKENNHISLARHQPREPVLGEANSEILEPQRVGNQVSFEARKRNLISIPSQELEAMLTNDFTSFPIDLQPEVNIDDIPTADFSFGDNDDAFLELLSPFQEM